jgi:Transposase DDE domain
VDKREEMEGKTVKWHVALRRGKVKAMHEGALKDLVIAVERTKAQIRARVEHPFHVVKNLFRHRKVRYRGLARNTAQLFSLFALANLVIARKPQRISVTPAAIQMRVPAGREIMSADYPTQQGFLTSPTNRTGQQRSA